MLLLFAREDCARGRFVRELRVAAVESVRRKSTHVAMSGVNAVPRM